MSPTELRAAAARPNDLAAFWMPFTPNRAFKKAPRLIARARDMHYYTIDGRTVLDATAGLWCCNAGHNRDPIVAAIKHQAEELDYAGEAYAKAHAADASRIVIAGESDSGAGHVASFGVPAGGADLPAVKTLAQTLQPLGVTFSPMPVRQGGDDVGHLVPLGVPQLGMRQENSRYFDIHHSDEDTLDKVEEPAWKLLQLLSDELNLRRIISALLDTYHPAKDPLRDDRIVVEVADKFDEMLRRLDAVRLVARDTHQRRGRGRPVTQHGLHNAYGWLAEFYKRSFGEKQFTQGWPETTGGLMPKSPASRFLYDAIRLIHPDRPRLAQELRRLMADDVKKIRGPRRGRRDESKRSRAARADAGSATDSTLQLKQNRRRERELA